MSKKQSLALTEIIIAILQPRDGSEEIAKWIQELLMHLMNNPLHYTEELAAFLEPNQFNIFSLVQKSFAQHLINPKTDLCRWI